MNIELTLSVLALLVAIASAVFAFLSKKEAQKANNIAIHAHQQEILDAFIDFRAEHAQLGEQFDFETLNRLSSSAFTADLYLSGALSEKIKEYSRYAQKIYLRHQMNASIENHDKNVPEKYLDELWEYTDKCRAMENDIDKALRHELKIS